MSSFRKLFFAFSALSLTVTALRAAPAQAAITDWPTFTRSSAHDALARDASVTPATAAKLGVKWMTNLYAPDLGSPIVAYDAALKKTVVYVGNERGDLYALDASNGATLWSTNLGVGLAERDTPLFSGGDVYIGTAFTPAMFKLDGATGKVLCSATGPASFLASPIAATPLGGVPTVYNGTIDLPGVTGPLYALRQSDCSTIFKFTNWVEQTGPWASPSYALDKNGRALVVVGTADVDSKMYAIDAVTGARVWDFGIKNPAPFTYDIGAAADISAPGVNGFADGVVYVPTKYGIMYALDLTTGKEIWEYNFNADAGVTEGGLSTGALVGDELIFGYNGGAYDLNATTGKKIWHYVDPTSTEVLASPAVVGAPGAEVVALANLAGQFKVLSRAGGSPLYSYQTGGYVSASPAESNGTFFISSSDGFMYAFAAGGGNGGAPATTITAPAQGAQIAYGSPVTIGGAATGAAIAAVNVAVQKNGTTGSWYDAAAKTWTSAPHPIAATLTPTAGGATWAVTLPLQPAGATYSVIANAVSASGPADIAGARVSFTSMPSPTHPRITTSATFVPPGGTVSASASAFGPGENVKFVFQGAALATAVADSSGAVAPVNLTIPTAAVFGPAPLTATGATSGKTSTAPLDVENAWTQGGYDASRDSAEPNDNVLRKIIHVGPNLYIARAYYAPGAGAVESSPAILDDVAFFGDDSGTLTAVDTLLGSPLWSYVTPSGKPITAAPAIDGGSVFAASEDGTLYNIAAATGTLAGSVVLGGQLTSPAVASGTVYVASRRGTIYAVDEASGAVTWSHPLGAELEGPVALDLADGYVIAGDDSGHVSALALATGALGWKVEAGGYLSASPAVSGGVVYVGSGNGNLKALQGSSGATLWTYAAGSAIRTTPSVNFGAPGSGPLSIYIGTDDGTVTAVSSGGFKKWSVPFSSAVVGISSTNGDVVMVELANGVVGATRGPNDGFNFWKYQTGGSLDTTPAIVSGAVYVGAGDGGLYAFTPYGQAPMLRAGAAGARARLRALRPASHWGFAERGAAALAERGTGSAAEGPAALAGAARPYPLHVLGALARGSAVGITAHGGPTQHAPATYAIFWRPAGSFMSDGYAAAAARRLGVNASLAGIFYDSAAFPQMASDAAMQREVARVAALSGWKPSPNAQFVLFTAREAFGARPGFCAYHSAFDGAVARSPLVYAVLPYPSGASACGASAGLPPSGDRDADLMLPTLVRERTDMASDPLGNAWHDASGRESGDFLAR